MLKGLETFTGVNVEVLGAKFISIGVDGNSVFQGSKISWLFKWRKQWFHFLWECIILFIEQTLPMFVLSKLNLVAQLEALFQAMYAFFFHSLKKYLEFQKLCEVLMEKGNKLFQNVKTRWISMLSLMQQLWNNIDPWL